MRGFIEPHIKKRLTELRKLKGWTMHEAAKHTDIHASDMSKIESGRLLPYPKQAQRLTEVFGETIEQLMAGVEEL